VAIKTRHATMQREFAAKSIMRSFLIILAPSSAGVVMSCSLCWQLMRASAWMAAQELNQLINPVSEGSTSAVATARFPDFVQQTALDMAQAPPCVPLRIFRIMPATAPPSGSGSCRRGRGRGVHSCCNDQACSAFFKDPPPSPPFPIQQHVPT
jgi:hypothetical protein